MNSTNQLKLQSVLVALVNLPANEEAPPLGADLLTNPHNTIISLRDSGKYPNFLQLYENAYQQFLSRYSSQEKNKIVTPKGTAANASSEQNNEPDNTAVSVEPEKLLKTQDVKAENAIASGGIGIGVASASASAMANFSQTMIGLPQQDPNTNELNLQNAWANYLIILFISLGLGFGLGWSVWKFLNWRRRV